MTICWISFSILIVKNRSAISPRSAKSVAKTGQASNGVFKIEIFDQIGVYTGSRPLRVKVAPETYEISAKFGVTRKKIDRN